MSLAVSAVYVPELLNVNLVKRSGCAPAALGPDGGSCPPFDLGVTVTSVIDSAPAGDAATSGTSARARATRKRAGTERIESSSVT